ncbi:MAG: lipoate--protein ligase family protein [Thermoplasmata archaeon]|nr:lipoate--protein ligase family protein [Thermoplasmata archaeon]
MRVIHVEDLGLIHPEMSVAKDREILERCIATGNCYLHFYRREPPAVSVGHGERIEDAVYVERCREDGVVIVRRESAGSAVYTDRHTLEYAIALPEKLVPFDRKRSYEFLCAPVVEALKSLGYPVVFKPVNDILLEGKKISGSAQKRSRGAVLQHGTILLVVDYEKMDRYLKITPKLAEKGLGSHSERVRGIFEHHRVAEMEIVEAIGRNYAKLLGVEIIFNKRD